MSQSKNMIWLKELMIIVEGRRVDPMIIEQFLMRPRRKKWGIDQEILTALSVFREDYLWLYREGKELLKTLKSEKSRELKELEVRAFLVKVKNVSSLMQLRGGGSMDEMRFFRELPVLLEHMFGELLRESDVEDVSNEEGIPGDAPS